MFILDNKKTLKENFEGKRIVEFPLLYVVLKGFFGAESLKDPTKESKAKKINNLLISKYSLTEGPEEMSEGEEDSHDDKKQADKSEDSSEDEDDLESSAISNVITSLYKEAMGNPNNIL